MGFASQQSQLTPLKLEDLLNMSYGLHKREKDVIFDYVRNGETSTHQRKEYISNIIIIFNSFFEYRFFKKSSHTSSSGGKSSLSNEWAEVDETS